MSRHTATLPIYFPLALLLLLAPRPARSAPPAPETETLRITLSWGPRLRPIPLLHGGSTPHIAKTELDKLLRAIDPKAEIRWSPDAGAYGARFLDHSFTLYRSKATLRLDDATLPATHTLQVIQGQLAIPLSSLDRIFAKSPGLETNIPQLLPPPAPPPEPLSPSEIARTETALRASALAAAEPLAAARLLRGRSLIVIAPHPDDGALFGAPLIEPPKTPIPDPPHLTLDIARRVREIIAERSPALRVHIADGDDLPLAQGPRAQAILLLRLDWSPFAANRGYRLFTPPNDAPHAPLSRFLAHLLHAQLAHSGIPAAGRHNPLPAPFLTLRHAPAPALTLVLGHWSNAADRARLTQTDYIEKTAQTIARALLLHHAWIEKPTPEEPA